MLAAAEGRELAEDCRKAIAAEAGCSAEEYEREMAVVAVGSQIAGWGNPPQTDEEDRTAAHLEWPLEPGVESTALPEVEAAEMPGLDIAPGLEKVAERTMTAAERNRLGVEKVVTVVEVDRSLERS